MSFNLELPDVEEVKEKVRILTEKGTTPCLAVIQVGNDPASTVYVGNKNTKAIASTSIVSAIINIIVHLSLIKYIGLYAAVVSTLSAFFIMSIYRILDINKRYFKIRIKWLLILETIIVLGLVLCFYYINNIYLNILSILIAIIFAIIINKNSINLIFNLVKKRMPKNRGNKNEYIF